MDDIIFGGGLLISFALGLMAISVAYKLQKRYRTPSLSSFLYFQVFITVFGVYGLIGQVIARKILEQRGATGQTVETIGHFFGFLGLPFLILAWFMFLRLCWEMAGEALSRRVVLAYFLLLVIIFLAYGTAILLANLSPFNDRQYAFLSTTQAYAYAAIQAIVLGLGLSRIFKQGKGGGDPTERRAVRLFGMIWLVAYSLSLVLYLSSRRLGLSSVISIMAFFGANLAPLLYWRAYLRKHSVVPLLQTVSPQDLSPFLADFKISKREEEVIRELCSGKSNKEIGQALFISLQTVKDHIYRVYQKTNVRNRVQLINLIQSYRKVEREP
jgi:DNA-binding CsgD family transcriptional regulator